MKVAKISKALMKLLLALFKMSSPEAAGQESNGEEFDSAKILSSKLDSLSRSLLLEKMDCLNDGNQVKADMFNSALIAAKTFSKDLAEYGKTKEISFEEITKKITDKISESLSSESSVSAFNDFRNRGEKTSEAVKQFGERLSEITSEIDFGPLTNKVNEVSLLVCDAVSEHYSQSPLTPRQKNGLDPVESPESDNDLKAEKILSTENVRSNDNSGPGHSI